MAHHVQERITKPNFKHIFSQKKATGPKFDITIPPHLEQVIPENINTPLHGHATCLDTNTLLHGHPMCLDLPPQGTLTRKWTKISRPQNQNMETTEPLMIVRVGQKRQSKEALKTPKVSNDGDQKKSKNTGELSFLIPTMAEAGAQLHRVQWSSWVGTVGGWEPPFSSSTHRLGEIKRTHSLVSHGNETVNIRIGSNQNWDRL